VKRNILKVGALAGVASLALLAAGPALAADPVSQASAQGLNLSIAGNKVISGITTATNDGKKEDKKTDNTLPGVAGLVPGTNIAGLGVVLQDAYAQANGNSSACAGLTGQGGGLVQVGDKPCSVTGGQATTLNLATLDLGGLVADPSTIVGQVVSALGINGIAQQLQDSLVGPLTQALSASLGNLGLTGSLGVVAAHCNATPDKASGGATIANSHLALTLGGQTITLVDFPADPAPNTHVLTDLSKVTDVLLKAVTTAVTNALNNPTGAAGTSPLGQLGNVLSQLGAVTAVLGNTVGQITTAIQNSLITQLTTALQPLLKALQDNILDITLNKQPVPQKAKTFEATAMDLQVLPAAKQFTGSSLIGGIIGHVTCGPNSRLAAPIASPTPTNGPHNPPHIPKHVDSGLAGHSSNANVILAATTALLAMAGAAGLVAYRRLWMPKA
jgi:hypothetical protein